MKIKKVECIQFAGLKDKKIEFSDGLNVVYGKNEAGKSTMVEAISNVIFKDAKIGSRSKEDKDFRMRFFPYKDGDYAQAYIEILNDNEVLAIGKKWSDKKHECFIEKDGKRIEDDKKIKEVIKKTFIQGEATYNKLIFQKQRDFKESIKNITDDREIKNSVFEFVSNSVLELDGVSIEDLKANIDNEIQELINNWDLDKDSPLNNRGVNNPYKNGVGLILKNYYEKEKAKIELQEVIENEDNRDNVLNNLKEKEKEYEIVKNELDELKVFEKDALARATIEPKKTKLDNEYKQLIKVNSDWPAYKTKLENKNKELIETEDKIKNILREVEEHSKSLKKVELEKKLMQIREKEKQIVELNNQLNALKEITEEDVENLDNIKRKLDRLENQMNLGEFSININIKKGKELYITKDLDEKRKLEESILMSAKAYTKIETEDFDFEVKLKDFDIEKIRKEYLILKNEFEGLLKKFSINDVDEAREISTKRKILSGNILNIKNNLQFLLSNESKQELEEKLKEIGDIKVNRTLEEIKNEKSNLEENKILILAEIRNIENILKEWEKAYTSPEDLLNKMVDVKAEIKIIENDLSKLKPIPEGFSDVSEFTTYLNEIKEKEHQLLNEKIMLQQRYNTIEYVLQNKKSSKELEEEIKIYEGNFESYKNKAKNLIKLKEIIEETLDEINNNTFRPIVESFNRYLSFITNNKYEVKDFKETLDFEIGNENTNISVDLLSSGTYDTVALALKFALIDNMFDKETFIVLDDCLVDLDEERRQKAVELIKEFATKHQVIFTTCSMDTANLLDGKLICL